MFEPIPELPRDQWNGGLAHHAACLAIFDDTLIRLRAAGLRPVPYTSLLAFRFELFTDVDTNDPGWCPVNNRTGERGAFSVGEALRLLEEKRG